jgi:surfactin synthase thioesterase subunit
VTGDPFVTQIRRPQAPVQLFCLAHAGGGASAYALWPKAIGADIEVHAYMPAGRERRYGEKPVVDPAAAAAAIAARADRPFALFGHSLGGLVGFEVIRELRRSGQRLPVRLIASACPPPDAEKTGSIYEGLSLLDDEELLGRLAGTGDIPDGILAEPSLVDMLLPIFRTDFSWLDAYMYAPEPPLPVPVSAYVGDADDTATPQQAAGWRAHTRSGFTLRTFPGGHFFPVDHLAEVVGQVRADLLTAG